jgi:hypothetical protein
MTEADARDAGADARRALGGRLMWSTTATLDVPGLTADAVWAGAYADAAAWPRWNRALAAAALDGPLVAGATARVRFRTGLRLRFAIVHADPGRAFTDEARLPGARMGHRHALEPIDGGVRLRNTIYLDGPLAWLWAPTLGLPARRGLPRWQRAAADLAGAVRD